MDRIKNKKIEILAPAGSLEGMKAAMNAGCDAVYIGGKSFGARAFANNLDEETMLRAIDEAHIRGKNLYLTVNTLVKEQEMVDDLYNFLENFYLQGLDAVIVQDLGVMNFIHKHFPKLPIHASTQTTITMAEGANLLKDLGVTRLVTARELSFDEIKNIRDKTDLEIETFVHGALCYSYSGQCLMSSMIGGRSGNRGRCAQPCRMPYQFYLGDKRLSSDREKHLLSPKDINMLPLIPEIIKAGVDSFKIEGRMKRPEYAALVSSIYRKYVDYYLEHGESRYSQLIHGAEYEKDMLELMDIYNRGGFSQGYGKTYNGKQMMSMQRPNHSGVYVGDLISKNKNKNKNQVEIFFKQEVNAQDVLEIRDKEGELVYEFTLKGPIRKGKTFWANVGDRFSQLKIGEKVYRTKNNKLLDAIARDYMNSDSKQKIAGHLRAKIGKELKLTLSYQDISISSYQGQVQPAKNQPITKEKVKNQISRMGDSPYYLDEIEIDMDRDIFIPIGWLNEIRREAIKLLQEKVIGRYKRNRDDLGHPKDENKLPLPSPNKEIGIVASIQTVDQFYAALDIDEVSIIYGQYDWLSLEQLIDMARKTAAAKKEFYVSLPQISRLPLYKKMEKDIPLLVEEKSVTGFLAKNLEEIAILKTYSLDRIILDYNMYLFNNEARSFYKNLGINYYTSPIELNFKELKYLYIQECDIMVYGHIPLMVSAQCLYKNTDKCQKCKPEDERAYIVDRLGERFYVQANCSRTYNTILNGKCLSLLRHLEEVSQLKPRNIRLDFTIENKAETQTVIMAFADKLYRGKSIRLTNQDGYTSGHFNRGIN